MVENNSKILDGREHRLFLALDHDCKGHISPKDLKDVLSNQGLKQDDFRLKECFSTLSRYKEKDFISYEQFHEIIRPNILLIERALQGNMIVPDFEDFCNDITKIFNETSKNEYGDVASYIPELAKVAPDQFGVAICTIDGQRFSIGDSDQQFSIQSTCKTISYCLALEEHGEDYVHKHIGREPSGHRFNEVTFNRKGLPHNPLINAGAIMSTSLIKKNATSEERLHYILDFWSQLTGDKKVSYNESVYKSESKTGHRNRALGWLMLENKAFPKDTDLNKVLELYFQCCSIEMSAEMMSVVAATFANSGVCPANGRKLLKTKTVQNCLSLMYSCGMYDFSGEYAFTIGLPTKSGVGGGLLIVVPNLMGICTWSPRLDRMGNSARGIEFCQHLVKKFNVHHYDNLTGLSEKKNPRLNRIQAESENVDELMWAASKGDLGAIQRLEVSGINLNISDYDRRTPLHLAAAEGHHDIVQYFIEKGVNLNSQDRWGGTALDDALHHKHEKVAKLLKDNRGLHQGIEYPEIAYDYEEVFSEHSVELIWAASIGDLESLQRMVARGVCLDGADYDLRTPLHLAACEGHEKIVEYLVSHGVNLNAKDRWGNTPIDDAKRHKQDKIVDFLQKTLDKKNLTQMKKENIQNTVNNPQYP